MIYSSGCEYAIRALTHLARREPGALVLLRDIAAAESIPPAFLSKVFQDLVRTGLLRSAKGPGGGYTLRRAAAKITLYEIKEALDGTDDLERCAVGLGRCSDEMPCPQHERWKPLRERIRAYLVRTTLADMAEGVAEKRALLERGGRKRARVGS